MKCKHKTRQQIIDEALNRLETALAGYNYREPHSFDWNWGFMTACTLLASEKFKYSKRKTRA